MSPVRVELPDDLIADTLNNRARRVERGHLGYDKIPRLHVSSLIKSSSADFFCAREFVLRHVERRELGGSSIPPKFALLYAIGHFFGEFIVNEFLRRNPEYGAYAWGDWTCRCRHTRVNKVTRTEVIGMKCNKCAGDLDQYLETDLFNPQKTVVGHADLILLIDGVYYVYEFKTIDRADVVFADIKAPLGDHLLQASNYYYMLQADGKRVSKVIRFVYVDRSMTGLYSEKPFKEVHGQVVKADRLASIYDRAKLCHSSIAKQQLPKRKCETIDQARAKQCTVAVSCFNRTRSTFQHIPLALTHPSLPSESTAIRSTTKSGTGLRLKRPPKTVRTRTVSSP